MNCEVNNCKKRGNFGGQGHLCWDHFKEFNIWFQKNHPEDFNKNLLPRVGMMRNWLNQNILRCHFFSGMNKQPITVQLNTNNH